MKPIAPSKRSRSARGETTRSEKAEHSQEAGGSGGGTGKRILLADDDATVRESLQAVLTAEGFTVIPARNGEQALELVAVTDVDLALLDLTMPVKNGWDTFERLTAEHPLIPVIIITARPNQLFTALSAGAGALLEKPMDIPILLGTIRKLLAEPAEQRLARLAGERTVFHYKPAEGTS